MRTYPNTAKRELRRVLSKEELRLGREERRGDTHYI
jgi:hypothetical protein